jgi:hypothetical protein
MKRNLLPMGKTNFGRTSNILLNKADIGEQKPITHDLPPVEHCYGKESKKQEYGAGALTSSWMTHTKTEREKTGYDYIKLNKVCADKIILGPQKIDEFRETHDFRQTRKGH